VTAVLKEAEVKEIDEELGILPRKQAACVEALKIVQRHRGWVSDEALRDVAEYLEMTPTELENVATFYSLVFRRSVGRHVILVCDSITCWIVGYRELTDALERRLGITFGQTTEDQRFTLLTVPCLGVCEEAPALIIDDDLHTNLAPDVLQSRLKEILNRYE
jgi:NADH-quinone oxidoreductase subunit E